MKYVQLLPDGNDHRDVAFYLAMEEHLAKSVVCAGKENELFFMWQVDSSVVYGRNQVLENEVNVDYCSEHGIKMFRRKSGGGCVYADRGNVMLSYITRNENVAFTYNKFMNMLLLVMRKLGLEAVGTSHNDVLIDNRKVSGTAFFHLPGCSIVHATLLYDTNMEHMVNAITPGPEKLQAKGIKSVRQRITLLKDYISLNIDELKDFIRETLCDGELLYHQI